MPKDRQLKAIVKINCSEAWTDAAPTLVSEILTVRPKVFQLNDDDHTYAELGTPKWYGHEDRGGTSFPPGLADRVIRALLAKGYAIELHDSDHGRDWFADCTESPAETFDTDLLHDPLCDAVLRHPRGQIRGSWSADKIARSIRDVDRMLPPVTIAIVTGDHSLALRTAKLLYKRYGPKEFGIVWDDAPKGAVRQARSARIVLCHHSVVLLKPPELIFLVKPSVFAERNAYRNWQAWLEAPKQQVYALVAENSRLSRAATIAVEAVSGKVLNPPHEAPPVPVHVATAPRLDKRGSVTGLQQKRQYIWQNIPRNGLIAKIGKAISAQNTKQCKRLGLFRREQDDFLKNFHFVAVSILVENTEHQRELAKLLPRWESMVAHGNVIPEKGLTIATHSYAAAAGGWLNPDILIRADGGESSLAPFELSPKLVVDIADGSINDSADSGVCPFFLAGQLCGNSRAFQ